MLAYRKSGRIHKKVIWVVVEGGTEYQAGVGQIGQQKYLLYTSLYCFDGRARWTSLKCIKKFLIRKETKQQSTSRVLKYSKGKSTIILEFLTNTKISEE